MKKIIFVLFLCGIFFVGCASVSVKAPKDPIKVDISMRLDVYQHVEKDIDAIEGIVSGANDVKQAPGDKHTMLDVFMGTAYAEEEDLSPEVKQAAFRRKDRRPQLSSLEQKGAVGENKSGLVEIVDAKSADPSASGLVSAENSDRMVIYNALAQKNGASVGDIQKVYAGRIQNKVPAGTPIEVLNESTGSYEWKKK